MNDTDPNLKRGFDWLTFSVIAVAVIMLAIMISPKLVGLTEGKRRAMCLNNLKMIGLALRLYDDNRARFPTDPHATTIGSMSLMTNNYMTNYKTWVCPSDTGIGSGSDFVSFTTSNLSYTYNGFGLTEAVQPDTPLMMDRSSGDIRSTTPWANNRWTHKTAGGNVLYADGHVEFRKTLPVPMYNGKNP